MLLSHVLLCLVTSIVSVSCVECVNQSMLSAMLDGDGEGVAGVLLLGYECWKINIYNQNRNKSTCATENNFQTSCFSFVPIDFNNQRWAVSGRGLGGSLFFGVKMFLHSTTKQQHILAVLQPTNRTPSSRRFQPQYVFHRDSLGFGQQ